MELSAEMFSQIAASVGVDPAKRIRNEKRRADRLPVRLQVRITPSIDPLSIAPTSTRPILSIIRNLSPRGVSLEHPTPMAHGAQFLLHLMSDTGQPAVHLLCSAVHCSRLPDEKRFIIGAEFTCVQNHSHDVDSAEDALQTDRIRQSILS